MTSRKIHRGEKCKPMYNAIAFLVWGVFVSSLLLAAGFGTQRATSWAFVEEDVAANRGTEALSALERSSCSLVKGDEESLKLLKMPLHGWEYGHSTGRTAVPRTVTRKESPMPQLTSPIPLLSG